jgi:hypothetical protein
LSDRRRPTATKFRTPPHFSNNTSAFGWPNTLAIKDPQQRVIVFTFDPIILGLN